MSDKGADRTEETGVDTPPVVPPERARRPRRSAGHHALRFTIGLISLLFLLTVLAGLAALSFTGREIVLPSRATVEIESRINESLGGAKVSVGQLVLRVDDSFVPRITARHVGIIDPSGAEIARLDTVRASLSKERLFDGEINPDTLYLSGAQITVRRDTDGAFALDFGGIGGAAGSMADVLEAIDTAFSTDPLSQVTIIEARDVTVTLEDARSGRIWQATDAVATLENGDEAIDINMDFSVFNGTENLSEMQFSFRSLTGSLAATIALTVKDAQTSDFAPQSPALAFLSVIDAPVSASMRGGINADGALAGFAGSLEIGAGVFDAGAGATRLAFDGAKVYVDYTPATERVELVEASVVTEAFEAVGHGHVLLRDFVGNWPQRFEGQLDLERLVVQPEDVFVEPLIFDAGVVDMSFAVDPFEVQIGQLALGRGDLWLRGDGWAKAREDGWHAGVQMHLDEIDHGALMALWPQGAVRNTRDWLMTNVDSATYHDLDIAVTRRPDRTRPDFYLDWDYTDASIKFMKTQPPLTGAAGTGTILHNRLTVTSLHGEVTPEQGGPIQSAGTVLTIPDITVKPARMELDLHSSSTIEAALSMLSAAPFNVLRGAAFGPDVAEGQVRLDGRVSFDLMKKIPLEEITFDIGGELSDVSSVQIVKGKTLSAQALDVAVDSAGMAISGNATLDGAQLNAAWKKAFGPAAAGLSDLTGTVQIDRTFLDAFGVLLPEGSVEGAAAGTIGVEIVRGQPPRFDLQSDLVGLELSIPAIGWRKSASEAALFSVSGTAGEQPEIDGLSFEAAGLSARNASAQLTEGGALARLTIPALTIGNWLEAPVSLVGRGAGQPLGVEIAGGRFDLTASPFGGAAVGGGAGRASTAGGGGPVSGNFETLIISEQHRLTGARVDLSTAGGLTGTFSGRLGGSAPISGTVKPGPYGPTITVAADDAGAAMVAAGLMEKGRGGSLDLSLTTRADQRSFDGALRVRDTRVESAPQLAELLSLASVVGVLDQMVSGSGIGFSDVRADFILAPERITLTQASAEGPSLGISLDGIYDTASETLDMQGVISPVYFLNALGQVVARKGEGLFGFNFSLTGSAKDPKVSVNPLSILTPGALRNIFRRPSPTSQPDAAPQSE
ncbi:AsmA-like C-terminal region-containing protein [Celeribacter sp.]|uniref:YhdP family protein n=1 Tax=Celeribacter sp. TaxID=1890673 RepID=UPI003A9062FF